MPGDFLGIIGPNGSGKTTLLRVMLGLLPPTGGAVRLLGQPPPALREWGRIGYVPQKIALDPGLPITVTEVVTSGLVAALGPSGGSARRPSGSPTPSSAWACSARPGPASARCPRASSSASSSRARSCRTPSCLILDEPTGGVDPEAQTSFYALLRHLNRERDVALVLVSHDIGVVAREVTQLACLNRRLVFHGRPADFLGDPALLTALYGAPVRVVEHHDH